MILSHYLAIGLGGAMGAIARVALGEALPHSITGIPSRVLSVNILGCFLMGLLAGFMALRWSLPDHMRYFLISGFLGGFTTFSAFALDFGLLCDRQLYLSAITYATLSFVLSIGCFFIGMRGVRIFA